MDFVASGRSPLPQVPEFDQGFSGRVLICVVAIEFMECFDVPGSVEVENGNCIPGMNHFQGQGDEFI